MAHLSRFDVLVVPSDPGDVERQDEGCIEEEMADLESFRDQEICLTPELWVGAPRDWDWERIMVACLPSGISADLARLDPPYYALVRAVKSQDTATQWDWDQELQRTLMLSRLVHCHSAGYAFRARVTRTDDGTTQEVFPPFWDNGSVYHPNIERNYVNPDEWKNVGRLLEHYSAFKARDLNRVTSALFFREAAALEYWNDIAWALLGTAVERLVGPDWNGPNGQRRKKLFCERLPALAELMGTPISEQDAKDAWGFRSLGAHGECISSHPLAHDTADQPIRAELYDRVVRLLSDALRKAILDEAFAMNFESEASVAQLLNQ